MEEKEVHLRDYLRVVARRKFAVVTFFTLAAVVALLIVFTDGSSPMYQAETRAVIERNIPRSLISQGYEGYSGYDPEFLQTQIQIITSQGVAGKVVEAIGVEKLYAVYFPEGEQQERSLGSSIRTGLSGLFASVKEIIGIESLLSAKTPSVAEAAALAGIQPPSKEDIVQSIVRQSIVVTPIEGTRVISIGYACPNPVLAMTIANNVTQAYIDQLMDMRMELSGYSIEWMKKKADEQRKKLEESEKLLYDYKRQHDIVTIEDQVAILPQRLAEFSDKLTKAEARRKEMETIYNQVRGKSGSELEAVSVVATTASVDLINGKILEFRQEISELSKKFGPKHPKMVSAQNQLRELQQTKQKELQKAVKTIENEYLLAVAQEGELRKMLDRSKQETALLDERSIQLDVLKRNVDTNKYLYDALIKQMEAKGITEKDQLVNVWVIEKAKMPEAPLSRGVLKKLLIGLLLGLFGGVGLAFFLEYLDNTAKSPEDIEERFELPVIGAIEVFRDDKTPLVEHVVQNDASGISESFKNLRTSILLSGAGTPPRVLLVTSMSVKDGKSTVASCLAVSMARNGLKVLLVDGDMRRPRVHTHFSVENTTGLSACLAGTESRDLISSTVVPNMDIMTAGPVPPNPSELLSTGRLDLLLKKAREKYDIIILDGPPLGIADAVILSRKADGVVLLANAGETRYEMLERGIKKLHEVSAKITGIVLNRFNVKKSGYYYHYSDYYYSADTNGK